VNIWIAAAGIAAGLGVFLVVREILPGRARLDAALARLDAGAGLDLPAGEPAARQAARRLGAAAPWLPVPSADLAILGQDREAWIASKIVCGAVGLAVVPFFTALVLLAGGRLPWVLPAAASLAFCAAMFFAPDLVTKVNAAERRTDFRHALTSYLDLVALERGAGAAPTEALEAAAGIGGGWAFERIGSALDEARKAGLAPWAGLAALASQTGVTELADLADIAGVAAQEGARIIETLSARAASMRAQALSGDRATAGSRSTTMVIPIALLGAGFLLLIIFPVMYRTLGAG
jgi:Type II secretion system (T2SS), protein F